MSVIAAVAPARLGASTTAGPAVLDDVVVAGVSMRRLVEVCGTPCVHSGDAAGIREGGVPARSPAMARSRCGTTRDRRAWIRRRSAS